MLQPRQPIETVSFNLVLTRIAYQLIVLDYRRNPDAYKKSPPTAMLILFESLRQAGFGTVAWPVLCAAKWVAVGYTLAQWREEYPWLPIGRAKHKQRPPR
jgi:hypothetical protein